MYKAEPLKSTSWVKLAWLVNGGGKMKRGKETHMYKAIAQGVIVRWKKEGGLSPSIVRLRDLIAEALESVETNSHRGKSYLEEQHDSLGS